MVMRWVYVGMVVSPLLPDDLLYMTVRRCLRAVAGCRITFMLKGADAAQRRNRHCAVDRQTCRGVAWAAAQPKVILILIYGKLLRGASHRLQGCGLSARECLLLGIVLATYSTLRYILSVQHSGVSGALLVGLGISPTCRKTMRESVAESEENRSPIVSLLLMPSWPKRITAAMSFLHVGLATRPEPPA